jgi:hypothetical protein
LFSNKEVTPYQWLIDTSTHDMALYDAYYLVKVMEPHPEIKIWPGYQCIKVLGSLDQDTLKALVNACSNPDSMFKDPLGVIISRGE